MRKSNLDTVFVPPDLSSYKYNTSISAGEIDKIAALIKEHAGIYLTASKTTMIETRLSKRLREKNLKNFSEYITLIERDQNEISEFINSLTTNKTDFFREPGHFEFLMKVVFAEILNNSISKKIRIWSAAVSSGEEAYTLAMLTDHFFSPHGIWNYKILGTDIDTEMLEKAARGIYKKELIKDIPDDYLRRFFLKGKNSNTGLYRASDYLKSIIKFRRFNLIKDEFPPEIKFNIIFLRNVLIYFNRETIEEVIGKMHRLLKPGGYLFVGHSEALNSIKHSFKSVGSAVYKK